MNKEETCKWLRNFELRIKAYFESGMAKCPIHLSGGNEEILVDIFQEIDKRDYVFSTHRNHYHYLLHTGKEKELEAEILGRPDGVCGGKGRSMHIYDREHNFLTSGIVAGCCSQAVGVAWALKKKGDSRKAWCFVGDGATDSGRFWEAVRYAEQFDLPVTFIVEDNDMSVDSSKTERWGEPFYFPYSRKIRRYLYTRVYPHVGVGKWINF